METKKYEKHYSESKLWDKIKKCAKKVGKAAITNGHFSFALIFLFHFAFLAEFAKFVSKLREHTETTI